MAVRPDWVSANQSWFLGFAALFAVWFIPTFFVRATREDNRILTRLSRSALNLSADLYYLIGAPYSTTVFGEAPIARMQRLYFRDFRFRTIDFLDELKEKGLQELGWVA